MKRLLIGPAGCGKTFSILNEFDASLRAADPLSNDSYFLLPSAEHTDRIISLLLQRGIKGFFHRRITTLSSLLGELFASGTERFASGAVRFLVLKDILTRHPWDYFQQVQLTPGFLNLMMAFISELKESFIGPEDFRLRMNGLKLKEPELAAKYEALAAIYEAYEQAMRDRGLWHRQDLLRLYREKGEKAPIRRRFSKIWLDGFFDFSNLQFEYLQELAGAADDMTVTLTYEKKSKRPDLFEGVRRTVEKLESLGFKIEEMKGATKRTESPALAHLERNLFVESVQPFAAKAGKDLEIFEAVGIQGEVEMIAREILHTYRAGGCRFSDFAVLLRQIGGYDGVIRSVFSRFGIPVEIHERERLRLSPMMETVRSLVLIFLEDWKREPLLNFLKSSYVRRLGGGDLFKDYEWTGEFENFAYQEGVLTGRDNWLRPWSAQGQVPEEWNELKSQRLKPLCDLEDKLKASHDTRQMENLLLNAVRQTFVIFYPEDNYSEPVRRDAATQSRLETLFEEIRLQLAAQKRTEVTFQEFAEHLLRLMEIDLYSLKERQGNRVQVYDISLARQKEYRFVFAAGLLEKGFPAHVKEDPVLSDWERELFNFSAGAPLQPRLPRQHLERYLFYLAVTRAKERLILTCPRLDLEGKESLPSFYLDEVRSLFKEAPAAKQQDLAHPYPAPGDAVHTLELETSVMGELWHSNPLSQKPLLLSLASRLLEKPESLQRFQKAFREIRAEITDPEILNEDYFKSERTSASALEDYAKCPYKYFSGRVLKLKDPREEVNARIKGTIRHQVLEHYFEHRLKKGKLSREMSRKFVLKEMEKALEEHPLVIEKKYQKDLYVEEIRDMLLRFLDAELDYLDQTPLQPKYLEYAFGAGPSQDAGALEIDDNGRKFKIVGFIDRIDVDPERGTALVVDYKTGGQWTKKRIEAGLSLQLPAYLLAVEKFLKLKPAGAHLRFLKTGKTSGFYNEENAGPYPALSKSSMLSEAEFKTLMQISLDYIKQFTKSMQKAEIPVQPREKQACDYCSYPAVCRIQKWRLPLIAEEIREKEKKDKDVQA